MAGRVGDTSSGDGGRRAFLKKAGIAAGAVWVAPTVAHSPAAHAQVSGAVRISLPVPPFGLPSGLGTFGGISWDGGTLQPDPNIWEVTYIPNAAIELVDLQLVDPAPGTAIGSVTPTPGPGTTVPASSPIVIAGTGPAPQLPAFFDVFVVLGP